MSCYNILCRLNEDLVCMVGEHMDTICKPRDFRNQCKHRTIGEAVVELFKCFKGDLSRALKS